MMTRINSERINRTVLIAIIVFCMAATIFFSQLKKQSFSGSIIIFTFFTLFICSYWIKKDSTYRTTSITFLYFLVFSIFHLGLIIPYSLGYQSQIIDYASSRWIDDKNLVYALFSVLLGIYSYTLGIMLFSFKIKKFSSKQNLFGAKQENKFNQYLVLTAIILFIFGITSWTATLISNGGLSVFFSSYIDYQNNVVQNSASIGYYYLSIGISFPLIMTSHSKRIKKIFIAIFSIWAIIAFQLGLRGEVLFPVVVTIIILTRNNVKFKIPQVILGAIIILSAAGIVKDSRIVGISNLSISNIYASPIEAIVELGGSIRPVSESIKWIESGDSYLYGTSYWAPIERSILAIIPISERLPAEDDLRLLNILVDQRVGPIGFSPIAEAYYNYGLVGIIIFMGLLGYGLKKLENMPASTLSNAMIVIILLPFLIQIRNSFTPVPFQLFFGSIFIILNVLLTKIKY